MVGNLGKRIKEDRTLLFLAGVGAEAISLRVYDLPVSLVWGKLHREERKTSRYLGEKPYMLIRKRIYLVKGSK